MWGGGGGGITEVCAKQTWVKYIAKVFNYKYKYFEKQVYIEKTSVYREKSIPMIALWCPAFSNHG